jgi:YVTN family beta-propeller protein
VIDGAANTVVTTVTVGDGPRVLGYDSIYNKAYCVNGRSNNVSVIDGGLNEVVATISVGSSPCALAWNPIQNRTYVANLQSSTVSVIRDSAVTGIEESPKAQAPSHKLEATIVRGVLLLDALDSRQNTAYRANLLDIGGRKVMGLAPGANDVRALAPGVYFIRDAQAQAQAHVIRKVVVAR